MKFKELDAETQSGIKFNFDKFIESTFDYCTHDYEAIADFLDQQAQYYKEELEYED